MTRDGGRPRRYIRIKSYSAISIQIPVVVFTREQTDKRSIYECIIGDLIRTAQEGGFYYEWYELESILVETDHASPLAASLKELAPNAAAAETAFVTLAEAGQIDNVTAAERAGQFETRAKEVDYKTGAIRIYDGVLYRCLQSHTSKCGWEPPETALLWIKIAGPSDEWPKWGQPVRAHDAYNAGDKVSHNGWKWVSTAVSNVWKSGVYGWAESDGNRENYRFTMGTQYTHLTWRERLKTETRLKDGWGKQKIADELGRHVSSIYREKKRGLGIQRTTDLIDYGCYIPDIAQAKYEETFSNKGPNLKTGKIMNTQTTSGKLSQMGSIPCKLRWVKLKRRG